MSTKKALNKNSSNRDIARARERFWREAISYTRSNWDALNTYLEDGDLSIDNNFTERAMCRVAVGRKN